MESGAESGAATRQGEEARARRRRLVHRLGLAASVVLFAVAAYVLTRTLAGLKPADLAAALRATSAEQIAAALAFVAVSYLALTLYDVLALRHLRANLGYRIAAIGSFTSFALSFTLGFPLITAGTVRYWVYARRGLSAGRVAAVTIIAGVAFWLGMGLVAGAGLLLEAERLSQFDRLSPLLNRTIGAGLLALIAAYCVFVGLAPRRVRLQGYALDLPGLRITLAQALLGAVDVCAGAATLYALAPAGHGDGFVAFAAVYAFACALGVASHAPGGIGVFEATMLQAYGGAGQEGVLASLLLFRLYYYLLPFVLALALLGALEGVRRWRYLREAYQRGDES